MRGRGQRWHLNLERTKLRIFGSILGQNRLENSWTRENRNRVMASLLYHLQLKRAVCVYYVGRSATYVGKFRDGTRTDCAVNCAKSPLLFSPDETANVANSASGGRQTSLVRPQIPRWGEEKRGEPHSSQEYIFCAKNPKKASFILWLRDYLENEFCNCPQTAHSQLSQSNRARKKLAANGPLSGRYGNF